MPVLLSFSVFATLMNDIHCFLSLEQSWAKWSWRGKYKVHVTSQIQIHVTLQQKYIFRNVFSLVS